MPRNARIVAPGVPYHVTQRGTNRRRVFFTGADRSLYLRLVRENLEDAGCRVLAYCLMTNHVHFVVIPDREDSLAVLFGRANGSYAQALNIRKGRCGHLWQARYHSCPMSGSHFWVGLPYVECSPCRAGMVNAAGSTLGRALVCICLVRRIGTGFWIWIFGSGPEVGRAGRSCHQRSITTEQVNGLRKCTYAGRPFGEEEFLEEMGGRFRRKWRRSGKEVARKVGS